MGVAFRKKHGIGSSYLVHSDILKLTQYPGAIIHNYQGTAAPPFDSFISSASIS